MTIFTDLLRMDDVARGYGCGLNPKLRAAIEVDLRWPSKAASPGPSQSNDSAELPANVTCLKTRRDDKREKRA